MTTITPAPVRNGIDTAQVYGTLDALKAQPDLARFEFRVNNHWISGPHSRSTIRGFWGAGQEDTSREAPFEVDASEATTRRPTRRSTCCTRSPAA
jgi:hypothetical protein